MRTRRGRWSRSCATSKCPARLFGPQNGRNHAGWGHAGGLAGSGEALHPREVPLVLPVPAGAAFDGGGADEDAGGQLPRISSSASSSIHGGGASPDPPVRRLRRQLVMPWLSRDGHGVGHALHVVQWPPAPRRVVGRGNDLRLVRRTAARRTFPGRGRLMEPVHDTTRRSFVKRVAAVAGGLCTTPGFSRGVEILLPKPNPNDVRIERVSHLSFQAPVGTGQAGRDESAGRGAREGLR
jgi:hypothetical protein